jgi:hypothetical protein
MRKYTFTEAVELMEQGVKMRMIEWSYPPESFVALEDMSNFTGVKIFMFLIHHFLLHGEKFSLSLMAL